MMRIVAIEQQPFHTMDVKGSRSKGKVCHHHLPFIKIKVDMLPPGMTALVATSDLQSREAGPENRLLGEAVAEELAMLVDVGEIPPVGAVLLAGDLYDHPDTERGKLGGTGDVTSVWNAFADKFKYVIGVHGNHDEIKGTLAENTVVLDGDTVKLSGITVGGVSGIVGKPSKNQRKTADEFETCLAKVLQKRSDIILLHQGPDDPTNHQKGDPVVREYLESNGQRGLVIFGHCYWSMPLIDIGEYQVLNVDSRVYVMVMA